MLLGDQRFYHTFLFIYCADNNVSADTDRQTNRQTDRQTDAIAMR